MERVWNTKAVYQVYRVTEEGHETEILTTTSEKKAADAARRAARTTEEGKVYVTFTRVSDKQGGFLNWDGHSPVGEAW
jgi:hypothetical protein